MFGNRFFLGLIFATILAVSFWGCNFLASSSDTISNPVAPSGGTNIPSFAEEQAAVSNQINAFTAACKAKNITKATEAISPEFKAKYQEFFTAQPEGMAVLADLLQNASMSFLTPTQNDTRYTEIEIATNGVILHVGLVKYNGQWLLERL